MSRKRAALAFLLVAVCYVLFVFWTIQEYNNYVTDLIARYEEKMPGASQYVDPWPYWHFWYGKLVFAVTCVLVAAGMVLLAWKLDRVWRRWSSSG